MTDYRPYKVHCVQNHDALVAALKGAVEWMSLVPQPFRECAPFKRDLDAYQNVIVKAEIRDDR